MKTAMILAAGRGERLKPLTNHIPKALCAIKGMPLIEHHVYRLKKAGFERIVINHAHLGGQIRNYLGNGSRYGVEICYSPEPPGGLETGGGIIKALPLLGERPFLTINADIFTDFDLNDLNPNKNTLVHLVLVNKNPLLNHQGDFGLTTEHYLTNENPSYTFAGIAWYQPEIFISQKQGRYSITPLIRTLVQQEKASAQIHHGIWYDVGSLERLKAIDPEYRVC